MITIEQCRAARGLLAWTQQDLAESSGLSKTAINNFEKGHSDIKVDSLRAIRLAFESADVEFIGTDGIMRKRNSAEIFSGDFAFEELLDDILETCKNQVSEISVLNSNGKLSTNAPEEKINAYNSALQKLNITERTINKASAPYDWGNDDSTRTITEENLNASMCSFIYGSKVAFLLWDSQQIVVVNSVEASTTERKRFEILWEETSQSSEQNNKDSERNNQRANNR